MLSDGVFPISGEIAPVTDYLQVLERFEGGWLGLDDAHATGVLGAHGRGTLEHFGIQPAQALAARAVAGHTLSKAVGGYGGIIGGPADLIAELEQNSRVSAGASPPPLPVAAASARALALAGEGAAREKLRENVARARRGLRALGWPLDDSPVPIICLRARPGVDLGSLKDALFERDLCVAHVRSYSSTPPGGALRVAIFATHTHAQIDRLVNTLAELLPG